MKIAIDCRMSGMSGIGVYFDNILDYFLSDPANSYLLIGDSFKLKRYEGNPKCHLIYTETPVFSLKEIYGFPTKEINKCDVFYSPNFNVPFGIKIPIYATIHDVVFLDVEGLTSKIGKIIRKLLLWRTVQISKKIFTVSNFSKERIQFHFKKTPEIVVAYNGINHELKNFKKSEQDPYPFQYILFIGNIKKHKRLDVLLDAYHLACDNGFSQKLVIVGDYKNFKTADTEILDRIDEHDKNVVFTGRISNDQLYNTIANASLLVQPSIYEGFGIPPLEALYLGCNVLTSNIPVFREIYKNLPVTFFEANNVEDLAEKIVLCVLKDSLKPSIKAEIDENYNFDRTAKLIMSMFKY